MWLEIPEDLYPDFIEFCKTGEKENLNHRLVLFISALIRKKDLEDKSKKEKVVKKNRVKNLWNL